MKYWARILGKFRNPLVKNTLVYTIASGLNAGIPFLMLPIITTYLSPVEYGIVATFMVFNSIFVLVIGVEQQSFISVNYFSKSVDAIKKYVTNVLFASSLLFLSLLFLVLFIGTKFDVLYEIRIEWILFSIAVAFTQFISQIHLTLMQLKGKAMQYGFYQVGNSLVNYAVSILLIVNLDMGATGRMWGIIGAALLFGLFSFSYFIKSKYLNVRIDWKIVKMSMLYSLPLVPHGFAGWINTAADRLIINNSVGIAENGIYSIGFQVAMMISLVASSFNKAFIPHVYKTLSGNDLGGKKQLVRYTYFYFAVLIGLAAALAIFSMPIIKLLADEKYYGAEKYIYWIIIGFTADGLYYGVVNYIYYSKRTFLLSVITFSTCIVHFVLSMYWIPKFGAIGAAYSTTVSYSLSFIVTWIVSNKVYPMPWFRSY